MLIYMMVACLVPSYSTCRAFLSKVYLHQLGRDVFALHLNIWLHAIFTRLAGDSS